MTRLRFLAFAIAIALGIIIGWLVPVSAAGIVAEATQSEKGNVQTSDRTSSGAPRGACVDANGSWVNWPWPNVPMLSPPCATTAAKPADKK
jgi:hypothetical protein